MNQVPSTSHYYQCWHRYWFWIIGILISLGILFRIIHLDQPVYWVDEVATSMRISGYTQADVTQQLAIGLPLSPADILQFQQINPDRSFLDLLAVLSKSPEHAPLYFILMRGWAELFGTSVIAMRSLSVLFSLLALPAIFSLCQQLFEKRMSWTATALLAISPFFISYAQEARPYSLWVLLLLVWHWGLWRSLQSNRLSCWLSYALALTFSLYTSLLTVLVMAGQGFAVILLYRKRWRTYLITTGIALVAFLPWCWVIAAHWQTLQDNTSWMQEPMPLWALLGVWFYGLSVLFFDVPVAAGMPVVLAGQMLTSLMVMMVMIYAVYALMTDTHSAQVRNLHAHDISLSHRMGTTNVSPSAKSFTTPQQIIGLFLFPGALAPPMALLTLDLIRDGQSAATPRYLMPVHLAVLIAVAYLVSDRLFFLPFNAMSSVSSYDLRAGYAKTKWKLWKLRRLRAANVLRRICRHNTFKITRNTTCFLGASNVLCRICRHNTFKITRNTTCFLEASDVVVGSADHHVKNQRNTTCFFGGRRFWALLTAGLLSITLLSCLIGITHTSDYQKSRNLSNPAIIKFINQARSPLILTEADNIQDVISLSYGLNRDVHFSILPPQGNPNQWLPSLVNAKQLIFVFNPSDAMKKSFQDDQLGTLTPVYQPTKLIANELGLTLWTLDAASQS